MQGLSFRKQQHHLWGCQHMVTLLGPASQFRLSTIQRPQGTVKSAPVLSPDSSVDLSVLVAQSYHFLKFDGS